MFHAYSGCDTTSAFSGKGKKSVWRAWQTYGEATDVFASLARNPFQKLDAASWRFQSLRDWLSSCMRRPVLQAPLSRQGKSSSAMGVRQWGNCHPPKILYCSTSDGQFIRLDSGQPAQSHSKVSLLQGTMDGPRNHGHKNQYGWHFQKSPQPAENLSKVAVRGIIAAVTTRNYQLQGQ